MVSDGWLEGREMQENMALVQDNKNDTSQKDLICAISFPLSLPFYSFVPPIILDIHKHLICIRSLSNVLTSHSFSLPLSISPSSPLPSLQMDDQGQGQGQSTPHLSHPPPFPTAFSPPTSSTSTSTSITPPSMPLYNDKNNYNYNYPHSHDNDNSRDDYDDDDDDLSSIGMDDPIMPHRPDPIQTMNYHHHSHQNSMKSLYPSGNPSSPSSAILSPSSTQSLNSPLSSSSQPHIQSNSYHHTNTHNPMVSNDHININNNSSFSSHGLSDSLSHSHSAVNHSSNSSQSSHSSRSQGNSNSDREKKSNSSSPSASAPSTPLSASNSIISPTASRTSPSPPPAISSPSHSHSHVSVATFSMGSFWYPQRSFSCVTGVVGSRVGYCGGTTNSPTETSLGDHSMAIQIDFVPSECSFSHLLDIFFAAHHATVQGPKSLQSVIWYHSDEQKKFAEMASRGRFRTGDSAEWPLHILPLKGTFHLAESHHQNFLVEAEINAERLGAAALLKGFKFLPMPTIEFPFHHQNRNGNGSGNAEDDKNNSPHDSHSRASSADYSSSSHMFGSLNSPYFSSSHPSLHQSESFLSTNSQSDSSSSTSSSPYDSQASSRRESVGSVSSQMSQFSLNGYQNGYGTGTSQSQWDESNHTTPSHTEPSSPLMTPKRSQNYPQSHPHPTVPLPSNQALLNMFAPPTQNNNNQNQNPSPHPNNSHMMGHNGQMMNSENLAIAPKSTSPSFISPLSNMFNNFLKPKQSASNPSSSSSDSYSNNTHIMNLPTMRKSAVAPHITSPTATPPIGYLNNMNMNTNMNRNGSLGLGVIRERNIKEKILPSHPMQTISVLTPVIPLQPSSSSSSSSMGEGGDGPKESRKNRSGPRTKAGMRRTGLRRYGF